MFPFIKILVVGLAIILFFRFTKKILPNIPILKKKKDLLIRIHPILELSSWIAFTVWVTRETVTEQLYLLVVVTIITVLVAAVFGIYVFKDLSAGIILKSEYNLKPGEMLNYKEYSGRITHLGYLYMEIDTHTGGKIKIPYATVSGKEIALPGESSEGMKKYSEQVRVSDERDLFEVKQSLKNEILNCSYTSITEMPEIIFNNESDGFYYFTVYFHACNDEHALIVKELLKSFVVD